MLSIYTQLDDFINEKALLALRPNRKWLTAHSKSPKPLMDLV